MALAKKMKLRSTERIKVLVADDDGQASRRIYDFLIYHGFDCKLVNSGQEAKKLLLQWRPRVLLVDLLLPEANAFEILHFVQNEPALKRNHVNVLVMSGHNNESNVREAYRRGARDYIARPVVYQDLLNRIVFHCRDPRELEPLKKVGDDDLALGSLILEQALQNHSFEKNLYHMVRMSALKVKAQRSSIIQHITHEKGVVLASSDRQDIVGFNLNLSKYPEVQLVLNTGKTLVIDNLQQSRALCKITEQLKEIQFNAMVVFPLYRQGKIFGVFSNRMSLKADRVSENDVRFLEFAAKAMSLYLNSLPPDELGRYGLISA